MDSFLKHFVILCVAAVLFVVLQRFAPSIPTQKLWRKETKTDLSYWIASEIIVLYTFKLVAVFFIAVALGQKAFEGFAPLKSLSIYIQAPLILLLVDFLGYWIHRLFHTGRWWKYHSIHHSTKEIDFLSSGRFHILENIFIVSVIYLITAFFFGYQNYLIGVVMGARGAYGYFVHANLKWSLGGLRFIFSGPVFHRWHHSKEKAAIDKNFGGVFSAWDFIFGTAYLPEKGCKQPHNFGVKDDIGSNIFTQFFYPFR